LKDKARIKLFEAEHYLEDALARTQARDEYSPAVAIGHATDALILAIDALCHQFGVPTARRHSGAQKVFLDLIRTHRLPEDAAHWREFLAKANSQRAAFQYQGALTSRAEAKRFVAEAARFVAYVRRIAESEAGPI
jgi:hypothetical protein